MANLTIFPLLIAIFMSVETEVLPVWLVTICRWLPTTATFDLLRASYTPQTSFAFIALRIADILLFVIVLLGLVAWKIRRSDQM
jgi:ABC-type multidrug transport system permease subunit